jgi:hypothetical protein
MIAMLLFWFAFSFMGGAFVGRHFTVRAFVAEMGLNKPTSEPRQQG